MIVIVILPSLPTINLFYSVSEAPKGTWSGDVCRVASQVARPRWARCCRGYQVNSRPRSDQLVLPFTPSASNFIFPIQNLQFPISLLFCSLAQNNSPTHYFHYFSSLPREEKDRESTDSPHSSLFSINNCLNKATYTITKALPQVEFD